MGNARDVETLAKRLCREVLLSAEDAEDELVCSAELTAAAMESSLKERNARAVDSIAYKNAAARRPDRVHLKLDQ